MPFKIAFRLFALLDVVSIFLLSNQLYELDFSQIPDTAFSKIRIALTVLMYLLLVASAVGLWLLKKWGAIVYYVQFPIRLIVWVFSFGFLTYLGELTSTDLFDIMFRIVMILEFMRLYFTVRYHRGYFV